jgi:DNA-binding transcriptional MerR regulator
MTAAMHAFLGIGEVLSQLQPEFPDVTISKIRFLESEGLVQPDRTSSGYRKFSRDDVGRLRWILEVQRDHYLPLRVIKDRLEALDRGMEPAALPGGAPRVPRNLVAVDGVPGPDAFVRDRGEVRVSRQELLDAAEIDSEQLTELERHQLLAPRPGGHYDEDAVAIAVAAAGLSRFGIEARHLRSFRTAADREVGLVEQVVTPLVRQRGPEARARAEEVARELASLSVALHAALVKAGLRPALTR